MEVDIVDPIEAMRRTTRAVRDTQKTSEVTLDRVDGLRREFGARIEQIDAKVDGLAVDNARAEGKLDVLVEELRADRSARSAITVSAVQATIDVHKTGQLAAIDEVTKRRAYRRQAALAIIAGAFALWAAIVSARGC